MIGVIIFSCAGNLSVDILGRLTVLLHFSDQYEIEGRSLVFYLEDNGSACQAITEISRRITMPNGQRLSIHSNRSPPPNRLLTPAEVCTQPEIDMEENMIWVTYSVMLDL